MTRDSLTILKLCESSKCLQSLTPWLLILCTWEGWRKEETREERRGGKEKTKGKERNKKRRERESRWGKRRGKGEEKKRKEKGYGVKDEWGWKHVNDLTKSRKEPRSNKEKEKEEKCNHMISDETQESCNPSYQDGSKSTPYLLRPTFHLSRRVYIRLSKRSQGMWPLNPRPSW